MAASRPSPACPRRLPKPPSLQALHPPPSTRRAAPGHATPHSPCRRPAIPHRQRAARPGLAGCQRTGRPPRPRSMAVRAGRSAQAVTGFSTASPPIDNDQLSMSAARWHASQVIANKKPVVRRNCIGKHIDRRGIIWRPVSQPQQPALVGQVHKPSEVACAFGQFRRQSTLSPAIERDASIAMPAPAIRPRRCITVSCPFCRMTRSVMPEAETALPHEAAATQRPQPQDGSVAASPAGSAYSAAWRNCCAYRVSASASVGTIGVKSVWAIHSARVGLRM